MALGVLAIAAGVECWVSVSVGPGGGIWVDGLVALLGSELIVGGGLLFRVAGWRRRWTWEGIVAFAVAAAVMTMAVLALQYWLVARPWDGTLEL